MTAARFGKGLLPRFRLMMLLPRIELIAQLPRPVDDLSVRVEVNSNDAISKKPQAGSSGTTRISAVR